MGTKKVVYHFTSREIEIMILLPDCDYSVARAAKIMGISTKTGNDYVRQVVNKLGLKGSHKYNSTPTALMQLRAKACDLFFAKLPRPC